MRKAHIDYLKSLAGAVVLDGVNPFVDNFFEVQPPLDSFQEKVPFCVVGYNAVQNNLDKRFKIQNRINPVYNDDGTKTLRYVKRHFSQRFVYQLDFWLDTPDADILSQAEDMGILDQSLLYLSSHPTITRVVNDVSIAIELDVGSSGIVTDPAGELGLYKLFLEVVFNDGLWEIVNEPSMAGVSIKIVPPVEVESLNL